MYSEYILLIKTWCMEESLLGLTFTNLNYLNWYFIKCIYLGLKIANEGKIKLRPKNVK